MLTNNPADGYNTSQHRREKREMMSIRLPFFTWFSLVIFREFLASSLFSMFGPWYQFPVVVVVVVDVLLSLIFFPYFLIRSFSLQHNITAIIITHSAADPFEIEVVQHIARAHPVCILCAYYYNSNNSRGIMNDNHPVIMQSNLISIIWIHTQRKRKKFPFSTGIRRRPVRFPWPSDLTGGGSYFSLHVPHLSRNAAVNVSDQRLEIISARVM